MKAEGGESLKINDLILSTASIIIGAIVIISSLSMKASVAFFPKLSASFLMILGVILLATTLLKKLELSKNEKVNKFDVQKVIRVALVIAILFAYYLAINFLGYTIPTFLLIFTIVYVLDYRNLKANLMTSLGVSIGLYLIFTYIFQVHFPKGLFF